MDQASQDESMWTLDDVAAHLKVSKSYVRERVDAGLLRAYPLPGSARRVLRFKPADVRAFVRGDPPAPAETTPAPTAVETKKSA